jgi:hypothetical protein
MIRIVIAQRGWVFVGRVAETGDQVVIADARVVRRWGTDTGLGQLAEQGPQRNTVLDPAGTVRLHQLAVVAQLDAKEDVWAPALAS